MSIRLGTNIAALGAQRRLQESTRTLSQVFERLASGQRINRASDDAAGLAVADSLKADSRIYGAAIRNINDATSVLDVISSALDEQVKIITRMRELAEQAANGVNSSAQRTALNSEYQALTREFGRIGETTQFNGVSLLNRTATTLSFQAGVTSASSSQISTPTANTGNFSGTLNPNGNYNGDPYVDAADTLDFLADLESLQKEAFFAKYGQNYFETEVTDSAGTKRTLYGLITLAGFGTPPGDYPGFLSLLYENPQGVIYSAANVTIDDALGGTAALDFAEFGTTAQFAYDLRGITFRPSATYGSTTESAIDFTGIGNVTRARHALDVTQRRAQELSILQGQIGAAQSRLQSAFNVNSITRENFISAESSIRDADMAFEAARLVRAQILQKAGAAILAQANAQPEIALTLLTSTKQR